MPSTRKQKTNARKSREMDMMSHVHNLDVMLGNENSNLIEREPADAIEQSVVQGDIEAKLHKEMITGILLMRIVYLDKTMSDRPLRPFRTNSILGCPKKWTP